MHCSGARQIVRLPRRCSPTDSGRYLCGELPSEFHRWSATAIKRTLGSDARCFMNCSVCNGVMRAWIDMPIDPKKDELMAFGQIVRCDSCGLGRSTTMPQPEEVAGFYDLAAYYTHGESHMPAVPAKL